MHLSNRKSKIISELLNNNDCITGQHLANVTGVTARTIRGDIAELNDELGMCIFSISSRGYYISKEKKRELYNLVNVEQEYIMPITPESRQKHILTQLIINPAGVSIDIISKQLYVSKSTLDRDFANIKKRLNRCNLNLVKKNVDILQICGDEQLIRKMCMDFLGNNLNIHSLEEIALCDELNNIFAKVKLVISRIIDKGNMYLTGDEFDAAAILITVTIFRNSNGYSLNSFDGEHVYNIESVSRIIDTIESEFEIDFNNFERNYLQYNLHRFVEKNDSNRENADDKILLDKALLEVSKTFNYELEDELSEKIYSALINNSDVRPSEYSLVDIEMEYPMAFEMAVSLVNSIKNESDINKNENVLIKIILLIACSMERDMIHKEMKRRNVVIICQSGEETNSLIKTKLKRHFPGFNILGFFPLYRIEQAFELKPELIISTVMIESDKTPVIIINPLFKDYDVVKINTVLRTIEYGEKSSYEFLNLFKEELFIKDIEAVDKYDVVKKLFDTMEANGYADESFFQSVVERENISSTAIGNMVAIPHAISEGIGENVVVVGTLKKPIKWNNDNVQLVFLINIKNTANGNVKQIFSSFFDVISSNGKVERLIRSKNYYEFLKYMNQ